MEIKLINNKINSMEINLIYNKINSANNRINSTNNRIFRTNNRINSTINRIKRTSWDKTFLILSKIRTHISLIKISELIREDD